ncbi:MAG: LSM domain-containing protein, partial [Candidatus Diapherotrites archaeon]
MNSSRPFDFLNNSVGKNVIVESRSGVSFKGVLKSFDVHMNVVLENAEKFENGELKTKYD